jgi:carbon-monoxide dehydrogenase small subunit
VRREIRFSLNGRPATAQVAPHETAIEVLQEAFGLYGARESCAQGLCGCCTVVVDGKAVSGCLYLGTLLEGREVQTIEQGEALDDVQQAFIERAGLQCGFCTPGFILMTRQLLAENPDPSDDDIRHYLSGNLCRCATYPEIMEAVKLAAQKRRKR